MASKVRAKSKVFLKGLSCKQHSRACSNSIPLELQNIYGSGTPGEPKPISQSENRTTGVMTLKGPLFTL